VCVSGDFVVGFDEAAVVYNVLVAVLRCAMAVVVLVYDRGKRSVDGIVDELCSFLEQPSSSTRSVICGLST